MSDLIYRQVAIDTLIRAKEPVDNGDGTITIRLFNEGTIREAMNNIPTVDAVPVIRCKDCKFSDWYTDPYGEHRCYCMEHGSAGHTEKDFCSYAERETDE